MSRCFEKSSKPAGLAHLVERHLAKVEVASSSLVTSSKMKRCFQERLFCHMVPWPSGKAKVCKTFIPQFKSGWHLHKNPGYVNIQDFIFIFSFTCIACRLVIG